MDYRPDPHSAFRALRVAARVPSAVVKPAIDHGGIKRVTGTGCVLNLTRTLIMPLLRPSVRLNDPEPYRDVWLSRFIADQGAYTVTERQPRPIRNDVITTPPSCRRVRFRVRFRGYYDILNIPILP